MQRKQKGKPRGMRRDRDCQTCKLRSIKCDLNRPGCNACKTSSLECGGYPPRVVWKNTHTATFRTHPKGRTENRPMAKCQSRQQANPELEFKLNPTFRSFLDYTFSQDEGGRSGPQSPSGVEHSNRTNDLYHFLQWICAHGNNVVVVDASHDGHSSNLQVHHNAEVLISRICNYVLLHLQNSLDKSEITKLQSIRCELEAIINVSEAVNNGHLVAIFGIATFVFLDVSEGPFGKWDRHVQGARSLLDLHSRNMTELDALSRHIPRLKEIVGHLVWFDVMGGVVQARGGLIFDDWHLKTVDETFLKLVGCPRDSFDVFVALARLSLDEDASGLTFQAMSQMFPPTFACSATEELQLTETQNAWRCAAMMASISRAPTEKDPFKGLLLQTLVNRICTSIESIPEASAYYLHLATTVYIASRYATSVKHREVFSSYWQNCQSHPFPHYPSAQDQCEAWWAGRSWAEQ